MKALSVKPLWATAILMRYKTVECRTWQTDHRGPLLICASSDPWWAGTMCKHALCMVDLVDVVPFTEEHLAPALMDEMPEKQSYAWLLGDFWMIEPFEVKGQLHLYDVDADKLVFKREDESFVNFANRCYKPLMRWEDEDMGREETEPMWEDWMAFLATLDEKASEG